MRNDLHAEARLARALFRDQFVESGLGAMEFWDTLNFSQKMLAAVVVNDILICVANLGGRAEMSQDEWDNRGDRRTDIAPTPAPSSGIAWESTTPCYVKYVTEERYQKFSDKAKRWYKPYRCSACSPSSEGGV